MTTWGRLQQLGCNALQEEEDVEEDDEVLAENVVQPMTLEAERGRSTRGAMLDPPTQQDPKLRLEIGICGVTKADGIEVLEVSHPEDGHAHAGAFDHLGLGCAIVKQPADARLGESKPCL